MAFGWDDGIAAAGMLMGLGGSDAPKEPWQTAAQRNYQFKNLLAMNPLNLGMNLRAAELLGFNVGDMVRALPRTEATRIAGYTPTEGWKGAPISGGNGTWGEWMDANPTAAGGMGAGSGAGAQSYIAGQYGLQAGTIDAAQRNKAAELVAGGMDQMTANQKASEWAQRMKLSTMLQGEADWRGEEFGRLQSMVTGSPYQPQAPASSAAPYQQEDDNTLLAAAQMLGQSIGSGGVKKNPTGASSISPGLTAATKRNLAPYYGYSFG